jgi:hypothetical protein
MSINAKFKFDSAGQGLFYYGDMDFYLPNENSKKPFSIVYDCGTSTQIRGAKSHLSDLVAQYKTRSRTERIDLLAISHFDYDHISHIPELLQNHKPVTVMIPHLAKELRAVLLAQSVFKSSSEDFDNSNEGIFQYEGLFGIFQNPVSYFAERGAEQIIGIMGDDDNNSDEPNKPLTDFNPKDNKNFDIERLYLRYVGGGFTHQDEEGQPSLYTIYSGAPAYRVCTNMNSWLFRPLNVQERLPQSFYGDVRSLIGQFEDSWWELLKDHSRIKQLVQIYDRYIGKRRRNSHSLILRHYPEQRGFSYSDDMRHFRKRCYHCIECFEMCERNCGCDNTATVLLGDLELDGKAQECLERNNFLERKTCTVLIPHHGADSDDLLWLDSKLHSQCDCASLVVSYGTGNRYDHPKFIYDGTISRLRNQVAYANEGRHYKYYIKVRGEN